MTLGAHSDLIRTLGVVAAGDLPATHNEAGPADEWATSLVRFGSLSLGVSCNGLIILNGRRQCTHMPQGGMRAVSFRVVLQAEVDAKGLV